MKTRRFNNIGKDISLLGFGCMRLPLLSEGKQEIDYATAEAMVDLALKNGVNYFDTAYMYHEGKSEPFIGHALKKYPRESFNLATKMPLGMLKSEADLERIFAEQLERCQVEYFDFYLMHRITAQHYELAKKLKVYEFMQKKKSEGLIRHMGFSFHDHTSVLNRVIAEYEWDFAQIQLNYMDWDVCDAKGLYEALSAKNIPVVVMEPVRGGALATLNPEAVGMLKKADSQASVASWAIRYAASFPMVMCVLSGMSNMEQLEDNLGTLSAFNPLSDAERAVIDQAAKAYASSGAIPCTGCRYCMDCPSGVDIPRNFAIYNHYLTTSNMFAMMNNYTSLLPEEQAHNCVACGQCLDKCPQNIDIPEKMKEIAAYVASLDIK